MIKYRTTTDVLVIGSGAAGSKAAITAARNGADTLLVSKLRFGRSGATFFPGTFGWGMTAVLFADDSVEDFYRDIIAAGRGMAMPQLARVLAEQATGVFHELESYGINFRDEAGEYRSVRSCFNRKKRGAAAYDMDQIRRMLFLELKKSGARLESGVTVISLIVKDKTCHGALALDSFGNLFAIEAKAVILATGGAAGLYTYGLGTADQAGDGYTLGLLAGAEVINMEFQQIMLAAVQGKSTTMLQEKLLRLQPQLLDESGKEILPGQRARKEALLERCEHGPFASTGDGTKVDRAIFAVWQRTGQPVRAVFNPGALNDTGDYGQSILMAGLKMLEEKGFDLFSKGVPLVSGIQCFNGGLVIDEQARSAVEGLYAAGETAGGMHGANRLGGNAIASTQVFGAIAGKEAAARAKETSRRHFTNEELSVMLDKQYDSGRPDNREDIDVKAEIGQILAQTANVERSRDKAQTGLNRIHQLKDLINPLELLKREKIRAAYEILNALTVSQIVLKAVLKRKESRGPHYRSDYPTEDDRQSEPHIWSKDSICNTNFT